MAQVLGVKCADQPLRPSWPPLHRPAGPGQPRNSALLVDHLTAADRGHRPPGDGPALERRVVRAGGVVIGAYRALQLWIEYHEIG